MLSTLKNIKISVHTRRDLSVNEDIREYIVKIPQPKGKKVRETVLRQIQDLGSILTRATSGRAKFGEKEDEVSGNYFIFRASVNIERERKERVSTKTKKRKKQHLQSQFQIHNFLFQSISLPIIPKISKTKPKKLENMPKLKSNL